MTADRPPLAEAPRAQTMRGKIVIAAVICVPIIVVALVLFATPYVGGGVDIKPVLGEWKAIGSEWRVTIHPDKTIEMASIDASAAGASQASGAAQGTFYPSLNGMLTIKMNDGHMFTAKFHEFSPPQFDLLNKEDGHVTIFERRP